MKNYFEMEHGTFQDTTLLAQLTQQFIADHKFDVFTNYVELNIKITAREFITRFRDCVASDVRATMPHGNSDITLTGTLEGAPFLVWADIRVAAEVKTFKLTIVSDPPTSDSLLASINESFRGDAYPSIQWWYRGDHGPDSREVFLPPNTQQLHPEYYPDLGDPKKVLEDYMASDEAVLLLSGAPGTGKTTLLRYLIHAYSLKAHVIYDETLMQSDSVFQDFLFSEHGELPVPRAGRQYHRPMGKGCSAMIIEDADNILSSRERDGNHLMSRFLNVSDGLIKLPNRKLIFTTNIVNTENIDSAILRPGRCFAVIHTRPLNLTEAQAAAKVAGMEIPEEKREYSLAEIFNPHSKSMQVRRFGLGFTR